MIVFITMPPMLLLKEPGPIIKVITINIGKPQPKTPTKSRYRVFPFVFVVSHCLMIFSSASDSITILIRMSWVDRPNDKGQRARGRLARIGESSWWAIGRLGSGASRTERRGCALFSGSSPPFRREFLTATRLERARYGLRCTALLGRAMPYENRHGNRCTELWRGPLTLHGDNHPREIPTALGRGQSTLHTLMRQCPTFAYTNEAQRQRSAGPWPTGEDWRVIVVGNWKAGEWSVKN